MVMAGYPHVGQDADSGVQEQWCLPKKLFLLAADCPAVAF
jgi:hypothetical protein